MKRKVGEAAEHAVLVEQAGKGGEGTVREQGYVGAGFTGGLPRCATKIQVFGERERLHGDFDVTTGDERRKLAG